MGQKESARVVDLNTVYSGEVHMCKYAWHCNRPLLGNGSILFLHKKKKAKLHKWATYQHVCMLDTTNLVLGPVNCMLLSSLPLEYQFVYGTVNLHILLNIEKNKCVKLSGCSLCSQLGQQHLILTALLQNRSKADVLTKAFKFNYSLLLHTNGVLFNKCAEKKICINSLYKLFTERCGVNQKEWVPSSEK